MTITTAQLLTPAELAKQLHSTPATLAGWRYKGMGPKFVKTGRKVLYRATDVDAWLTEKTQQGTGEVSRVA